MRNGGVPAAILPTSPLRARGAGVIPAACPKEWPNAGPAWLRPGDHDDSPSRGVYCSEVQQRGRPQPRCPRFLVLAVSLGQLVALRALPCPSYRTTNGVRTGGESTTGSNYGKRGRDSVLSELYCDDTQKH